MMVNELQKTSRDLRNISPGGLAKKLQLLSLPSSTIFVKKNKQTKSHENTVISHENKPKLVKNITLKNCVNNCQIQIIASVSSVGTCVQKHWYRIKFRKKTIASKI